MAEHAHEADPARPPGPRRRPGKTGPGQASPRRDLLAELAKGIAEQGERERGNRRPIARVSVQITRQAPYQMYGDSGFSLVSNDFLAEIVAPLLLGHNLVFEGEHPELGTVVLTRQQMGVLVWLMGRQDQAVIKRTQQAIADKVGIPRTSVSTAIKLLSELNYVHKARNGEYLVNPRLAFKGNGERQAVLIESLVEENFPGGFPYQIGPAHLSGGDERVEADTEGTERRRGGSR